MSRKSTVEHRGNVLFADDDESVLAPTSEALESVGFTVTGVCTSDEARDILAHQTPDVILLDINMPGNEQLQFVQALSKSTLATPVVLMTGYPSFESAIGALRLGVVDYITKPPKIDELSKRLTRAITKGRNLQLLESAEKKLTELNSWMEGLRATLQTAGSNVDVDGVTEPSSDSQGWYGRLPRTELDQLSKRECDVLREMARGQQAQEIASSLGLSVSTVRCHIRSLFVKLKVNSQLGLMAKLVGAPQSKRN